MTWAKAMKDHRKRPDPSAFKVVGGAYRCIGFGCTWHTCWKCVRCDKGVCVEHQASHSCSGVAQ